MAVTGSYVAGVPVYYDPAVGPQPGAGIWSDCPLPAYYTNPTGFVYYYNDFTELTIGTNTIPGWAFTAATSGSNVADTTNPNGVLKLSAGAVTAGQGVNWQLNQVAFKVASAKPVWYETRLRVTGLSTTPKVQLFAGLAVTSTALIASNTIADVDMIAFQGISTTGVILGTTHSGAGLVTTGTGVTIATDVWYRLAFKATTTSVAFYVDDVLKSTSTTNIPTVAMAPAFVMQANATVTPVMEVDFVRVFGYR